MPRKGPFFRRKTTVPPKPNVRNENTQDEDRMSVRSTASTSSASSTSSTSEKKLMSHLSEYDEFSSDSQNDILDISEFFKNLCASANVSCQNCDGGSSVHHTLLALIEVRDFKNTLVRVPVVRF